MKTVCLILPVLLGVVSSATLPSYISPCKRGPDLNKCAIVSANKAIPQFAKGDSKLKIPPLDPIYVKELSIKENSAKSVALNLTFIDMKIKHLSAARLVNSKIDLQKGHIEWTIDIPKVTIESNYKINGKILVLPIRGKGPAQIDLEKPRLIFTLLFKLTRNKGVEYITITDTDLKLNSTQHLKIRLDNLFNGDKTLGDNMNTVLNDNWEELLNQMGPPIGKAIALAVKPIVDKIVTQVPYNQIFPK